MVSQEAKLVEQEEEIVKHEKIFLRQEVALQETERELEKLALAIPPTPPEPISPLDHVIEMTKKNAHLFYEGKKSLLTKQ